MKSLTVCARATGAENESAHSAAQAAPVSLFMGNLPIFFLLSLFDVGVKLDRGGKLKRYFWGSAVRRHFSFIIAAVLA
jgi:hypothetical protein